MYIPEQFKETSPERISALIEGNSFGVLITAPDGVPFVSHLPFLFDHAAGSRGKLFCHMARASPQWRHLLSGGEVAAVFQGPHAYVSPSWYLSPGVPTWNYAVVHLRGTPRIIDDASELSILLEQLTQVYESRTGKPSKQLPKLEQHSQLLSFIVGVEIEITEIQAKFKLSQNRSLEDQQSVIEKLSSSSDQTELAVASMMSMATASKP